MGTTRGSGGDHTTDRTTQMTDKQTITLTITEPEAELLQAWNAEFVDMYNNPGDGVVHELVNNVLKSLDRHE